MGRKKPNNPYIVKKLYESLGVEKYSEYNIFKNKLSA